MVSSDDLLRKIAEIEREIEELGDRRQDIELGLRYVRSRTHPLRGLFALMMLRDIERRMDYLKLRRNAARNSYLQLYRDEERYLIH